MNQGTDPKQQQKALVEGLHQNLQRMIGLHRQLLETVKMEREALVGAEIKEIQEATLAKQGLIEGLRAAESERLKIIGHLAVAWKKPARELTLSSVIIAVQGQDQKAAEQLRSAFNALTVLVKRVSEQNEENRAFVDRSLTHIHEMKKNVLGEFEPKSGGYDQKGRRSPNAGSSRLISKEA